MGTEGEPVSANDLYFLFHRIKKILDQAVADENGRLSHFEVLACSLCWEWLSMYEMVESENMDREILFMCGMQW